MALLEWVLALALSAGVILMVMQALSLGRGSFGWIDAMAEISDQARFAQAMIGQDLQRAQSRLPCANKEAATLMTSYLQSLPVWLPMDAPVWGWDAIGTQAGSDWRLSGASPASLPASLQLPQVIVKRMDRHSDLLLVFNRTPWPKMTPTSLGPMGVGLGRNVNAKPCALWVLSDCTHGLVFQDSALASNALSWQPGRCLPGNDVIESLAVDELWPRLEHLSLYQWTITAWFVGIKKEQNRVLYRARFGEGLDDVHIEEMVQGIETLQLEYTQAGPVPNWRSATSLTDWSSIKGVRIGLVSSASSVNQSRHLEATFWVLSSKVIWSSTAHWAKGFDSAVALRGAL